MAPRQGNWLAGDFMVTSTGKRFWAADPRPEELDIVDIAHGTANQIRFGGQINERYTVAQHQCHVLELVEAEEAKDGPIKVVDWATVKLGALVHDGAEAFLGDMPTPVKRLLPDYKALEALAMTAIERRWVGYIDPLERRIIKEADLNMLGAEARRFYGVAEVASWALKWPSEEATAIMAREPVWDFDRAKSTFLSHFYRLTKK